MCVYIGFLSSYGCEDKQSENCMTDFSEVKHNDKMLSSRLEVVCDAVYTESVPRTCLPQHGNSFPKVCLICVFTVCICAALY